MLAQHPPGEFSEHIGWQVVASASFVEPYSCLMSSSCHMCAPALCLQCPAACSPEVQPRRGADPVGESGPGPAANSGPAGPTCWHCCGPDSRNTRQVQHHCRTVYAHGTHVLTRHYGLLRVSSKRGTTWKWASITLPGHFCAAGGTVRMMQIHSTRRWWGLQGRELWRNGRLGSC